MATVTNVVKAHRCARLTATIPGSSGRPIEGSIWRADLGWVCRITDTCDRQITVAICDPIDPSPAAVIVATVRRAIADDAIDATAARLIGARLYHCYATDRQQYGVRRAAR